MEKRKEKILIDRVFNLVEPVLMMLLMTFVSTSIGYSEAQDVGALIQRLKDDNPTVRVNAAYALGKTKDPHAVEPLIAALNDKDFAVRRLAAEALGEIGKPAVEQLITASQDEDSVVRENAVYALGKIKDPRAVELLISALKDKNRFSRGRAARALEWIKDPGAVQPLITALKGKDLEIVAGAYRFFIRRGEKGTEYVLIKALDRYGDKEMAQVFLNCGNARLETAARAWATSRGYMVISSVVGGGPRWGSGW